MPRGPKPLKKKLAANQFYCVSCRARVTVPVGDIGVKTFKNSKRLNGKVPMLKGHCHKCGDTPVYKIIKDKAVKSAMERYGKA